MDVAIHNSHKPKSELREFYETKAQTIQNEIGDLEAVRSRLGLSARKMCQLLLVDPSSWTRWKRGETVPPHIWQSLQWYIQLHETNARPSRSVSSENGVWLDPEPPGQQNQELDLKINEARELGLMLQQKNMELEGHVKELQDNIKANRATSVLLGLAMLILAFAFYHAINPH